MPYNTFLQRIGYHWPCVALATILAGETHADDETALPLSLRDEASCNGLTYLQVTRYLPHADLYLARVADDPARLGISDLLAFFTEEQLTNALPWDIRLQHKGPGEIQAAIRAHAASIQPICSLTPADVQQAVPQPDFSALTFHPLAETIAITRDELCDALQATLLEQQEETNQVGTSPSQAAHAIQQALLLAALDKLMERLWQTPSQATSLLSQARCKLLVQLRRWQHWTRQRIVNASPRWSQMRECVVWELTIGIPVRIA